MMLKFRMKIHGVKFSIVAVIVLWSLSMDRIQTQPATGRQVQVTPTVANSGNNTTTLDDYKRLLGDLFSNYDPSLGPRYNLAAKADINTTMEPYQLYEMDTTGQALRVAMMINITWFDEFLVWDPALYGGINSVALPSEKIWHPKISMAADNVEAVDDGQPTVLLASSGTVMMFTHDQIKFPCAVDVTYYPFDTQTCTLASFLPALSASLATLRVQSESTSYTLFYENSEWQLVEFKTQMIYKGTHELVNSKFVIRRRAAFNVYTMLVPLMTLSLINAFTVLVPISSGDKGSISVTIFLAYGFFAALTRDALPHNSLQISSYVIYICVLLLISMTTCVYAMVQSRIFKRYGAKEFKFSFYNFRTSIMAIENSKDRMKEVDKEEESLPCNKQRNRKNITWEEALGNLDLFTFFVLILSLSVLNASFWLRVVLNG